MRSASARSVITFCPTSMTVAPGRIYSLVTMAARPIAATTMSARRTTSGRSFVFEWQMVTVAFACISSSAMGLPTISLRPMTTALAPSMAMPLRRRISITPDGVQATSAGRPDTRCPTLIGWKPSTSFCGFTASRILLASTCFGRGICTRMPSTSSRRFSSSTTASNSDVETVAGGRKQKTLQPQLLARSHLAFYVELRGGIVSGQDGGQSGAYARRNGGGRSRPPVRRKSGRGWRCRQGCERSKRLLVDSDADNNMYS